MKGFEPVTLAWKGNEHTVPADQQMRLIAEIEDALADRDGTPAVLGLTKRGGPSYSRLAAAYGAALRYAGAHVSDAEIYLSITEDLAKGDARAAVILQDAVLGLLAIIAPPIHRQLVGGGDAPGKDQGEEVQTPE